MSSRCPNCAKLNPADAYYCYFDGRLLSKDPNHGPVPVGHAPFPAPFCFPDGHACVNFNQLALACDNRWNEARAFLAQGIWPPFFGGMGRLDLAELAKQAAINPDPDRGLCQLLEKLPADPNSLRPPKLALESTQENLGQLAPGVDLGFDVVIFNKGMLLLNGIVSTSCEWLVFGDRTGPAQKMFQTRSSCAIPVRVLGHKLRAGMKLLQGEIVVDSNGGTIVVPVTADVPIVPFPKATHANDALAGARSPREIALKAKEHPNEAAILFATGAVKAWYAANGWTYPIEGSEGSGKGAVQQFFEALGLTKPPRLEISTATLVFKGKPGDTLLRRLTVRTEEAKPVYAQAFSDQDWVRFKPIKYMGNKVEIIVEVIVPPLPGETVLTQVTIQGNGKQQFVLPLTVTVEKRKSGPATPPELPPDEGDENWVDWIANWWKKNG